MFNPIKDYTSLDELEENQDDTQDNYSRDEDWDYQQGLEDPEQLDDDDFGNGGW